MEFDYDRKFQEMKKYIPFLESMIKRLEKTHSPTNPRQAQLDKIRSLRDLLMDKRKRMKMDNLLKCEQVLVNLYAKVEQGKPPGQDRSTTSESRNINLNVVRHKLKSVASKLHTNCNDTLPEIARANDVEESCVPGSKEPALFQRRPNISSSIPSVSPGCKKDFSSKNTTKDYSHLLLSPDRHPKPYTRDYSEEQSLFVRRSPKKSPRVVSPSYNRKERKKSLEEDVNVSKLKDLNITLQVPEDSLHSLNTKDIVSRIINCNDNDVDIETLRGLRTQILGELKETGAKDDISDIILKSYKNKDGKNKKSEEVEEGELSDSESETIESIYGSLVVINKDKSNTIVKSENLDTTKPCKIQICLVINPEKQKESLPIEENKINTNLDISDFELFENVVKQNKACESEKASDTNDQHDVIKPNVLQKETSEVTTSETQGVRNDTSQTEINDKSKPDASHNSQVIHPISNDSIGTDSNKTLSEDAQDEGVEEKDHTSLEENQTFSEITHDDSNSFKALTSNQDVEIPLLHTQKSQSNSDKNEVSEIDILQALKNEILSETSNVLSSDVQAPLFQPKITKVANAEEIGYKKRISIEKYKAKATNKSLPYCDSENGSKEDVLKKQSLKLTEKECERFFLSNVSFESFSDTEDKSNLSVDDVYGNLAPKSPDHEDFADTGLKPPIIIPIDPVEMPVVTSEKDIDMRKILPQDIGNIITPPILPENTNVFTKEGMSFNNNELQISNLTDPRMNRDVTIMNHQGKGISVLSSNHPLNAINSFNENFNSNFNQIMSINMPGATPNIIGNLPPNRTAVTLSPSLAPNLTPNRIQNIGGNMTPNTLNNSMTFDTTSRNSFDNDDNINHKHVYTTIYQSFESQVYNEKTRKSRWSNDNNVPFWKDIDIPRKTSNKIPVWENQLNSIKSSNTIPNWDDVGNLRKPSNVRDNEYMATYDRYNVDSRDPYIRDDSQAAARHSFRRIDCPSTTVTSFSRYDCPPTPTHPFGRQEPSMTSSHNFGGSEYTQVANAKKFNKSQDRRLYRNSDYDNYHSRDRDRERYNNYESKFNSISHDSDQCNRFNRLDPYRQNVGRHDRNKFYEQNESNFREPLSRRETDCRQHNREVEGERFFARHRGGSSNYDHRHQNESNSYDKRNRRSYHVERSNCKNTRDLSPSLSQLPQTVGSVSLKDKRVGIHSYSCNSLSIDKSSKNSLIETKTGYKPKFDARRQRASSVGRSISSYQNESRGFSDSKQSLSISKSEAMRKSFQRSSSVGREIRGGVSDFKDIKESLKSFKLKSDSNVSSYFKKTEEPGRATPFVPSCKSSNKRELFESGKKSLNTCVKYSPRKNNRDPRMCRESNEIKNKFKDKKTDSRDSKHCGIIYTNDNITKGTILGSGYGVKNYKIPKIKRNYEITDTIPNDSFQGNEIKDNADIDCQKAAKGSEIKNKTLIDLSSQSLTKDVKLLSGEQEGMEGEYKIPAVIKQTDIDSDSEKQLIGQHGNGQHSKEDKNVIVPETSIALERRVTRSATKNVSAEKTFTETSPIQKTRRQKKSFIIESDSDDNDGIKSIKKNNSTENNKLNAAITEKPNIDSTKSPLDAANHCEKTKNEFTNSSLGVDDIEIFSDNVVLDPVIDNINDLIADLDDDLESHKTVEFGDTDFSKDVCFENNSENVLKLCNNKHKLNILKNVQIPDAIVLIREAGVHNVNIDDTSLVITNSEKGISSHQEDKQESNLEVGNTKEDRNSEDILSIERDENILPTDIPKNVELNNEAIVSTTYNHPQKSPANNSEVCKKVNGDGDNMTTPDSTIENSDIIESKLDGNCLEMTSKPTIEMMDSDISSTDNNLRTKTNMMESSLSSTSKTQIESIGKLLSILQDKSKIRELLGLLGDQSSECEKIKKKLEKLSELVSDDEEIINDTETKNKDESQNKVTDPESLSKTQQNINIVDCTDKTTSNGNGGEAVSESNNLNAQKEILCPLELNIEDNESISKIESTNLEKEGSNSFENVKTVIKKVSVPKKRKKKTFIKKKGKKNSRLVGSDAVELKVGNPSVKKPSRELKKLQEDIREMFIRDDVLNSTGIRMCRIAKLVDEKHNKKQESIAHGEPEPIVVLKKFKDIMAPGENVASIEKGKKSKGKKKFENEIKSKSIQTSKVKPTENKSDPYDFETDSIKGTSNLSDKNDSSGSDFESFGSSKTFGSNELLTEIKKTKRRRRKGWKSGIIKSKCRKKAINQKQNENITEKESVVQKVDVTIPDLNCYIDKMYCFGKKYTTYDCRLCVYSGEEIVNHYKKHHPRSEIPCSRMSPAVAKSAITESEEVNIQAISKITPKKYVCRFCFKEFSRNKPLIESFFWHVVSVHTGEYKQLCSEDSNDNSSLFILDIPPPPTEAKGQLLGYICGKCNFTQISIENLKTHVILRHNDEPTPVYNINLASLTRPYINSLLKEIGKENENIQKEKESSRVLRSSRSNISFSETVEHENNSLKESSQSLNESLLSTNGDNCSENTVTTNNITSKITFENDIMDDISNVKNSDDKDLPVLKVDADTNDTSISESEKDCSHVIEPDLKTIIKTNTEKHLNKGLKELSDSPGDFFDSPHFKINYSKTGSKEYICCINGNMHYITPLLISFKKHVQMKHSEKWDGYCYICKVIVTPQGTYFFKDCLCHFLDKHVDDFPILEETPKKSSNIAPATVTENQPIEVKQGTKTYINVRPISELISDSNNDNSVVSDISKSPALPVIENVISLGSPTGSPRRSPSYHTTSNNSVPFEKLYKYEEVQAEMMSKKHRVVLDVMMSENKLGHVFKCSGRFCSFTSDSAEDAFVHASTHARLGGEDALYCVYCDFDCHQNAIDLITHVFKSHGSSQYICGKCFYRAAASQLVKAHLKRVHDATTSVAILHTSFKTVCEEDIILSREVAVPHYICNVQGDSEGRCKFKTYTPGKFCEHLQIRHASAADFKCFMCSAKAAAPADLVRHLKIHGLKLYQCCWCIHGADNESELLAHASVYHPTKLPKAYLRIITNKDGLADLRVLPLAHLTKSNVPAKEIIMSKVKDNPVKEAERSIELEKLLGQTCLMVETTASSKETNTQHKDFELSFDNESEIRPVESNDEATLTAVHPEFIPTRGSTPISVVKEALSNNDKETSIKPELLNVEEPAKIQPVIYCLDSDEDNSVQSSLELNNKASKNDIKVDLKDLFMCAKCKMVLNTGIGLKRHMMWCYASVTVPISCAHCSMKLNKSDVLNHYYEVHSLVGKPRKLVCTKCHREFKSASLLKEHRKLEHSNAANKNSEGTLSSGVKQVDAPNKRKRSVGSKEKSVVPEKTRRYGPQDVDLLPINPILDDLVFCSLCEFNTKVKLNMVRHLQLHAQQQPVPQTAPVNPVPHLETNEKHFDKMVNLASSSIVTRTPDKNKAENTIVLLPPEAASRFPKYVTEKQRLTCGAKGCTYISVDESMLKCHWETLHAGCSEFHCVHCPPHQFFDTSQPLTSSRIIAHLKMHDSQLYACSLCTYYHHKREIVQKHLVDTHKGGQVMVVREGATTISITNPVQNTAPTMDLKPWQCGLCSFKSLLQPEVVDHCAKEHNSKMQYKCAFCAFRTSNAENITKHQAKSHPEKPEEIFYYYYREGSIPDEPDGTQKWQKQRQKNETSEPQLKCEPPNVDILPPLQPLSKPVIPTVDLNLVKKEFIEPIEEKLEDICHDFGAFCDPNGLKYKCPLCKNVMEDDLETIQSHLYEELKYRKWGCSICTYKAFHKAGLSEHMQVEHCQNREPIALQIDHRVETWVNKLLEHQTSLIQKYKENLLKQKAEIFRNAPEVNKIQSHQMELPQNTAKSNNSDISIEELNKIFGAFGAPVNRSYCCPKCDATFKEEDLMQNHLESELNKIRWFCSACYLTFQTFHEAQFHCRSAHLSLRPAARPSEAPRDPSARDAWVRTVLTVQKLSMAEEPQVQTGSKKDSRLDESLLVVRYEENIPTPEFHQVQNPIPTDSDEEKLVIDESIEKDIVASCSRNCTICGQVIPQRQQMRNHMLKHYDLKSYDCGYCSFNGTRMSVINHQKRSHAPKPLLLMSASIPKVPPLEYARKLSVNVNKVICLVCKSSIIESEVKDHVHPNELVSFAKKGDVVLRCIFCSALSKDLHTHLMHHQKLHPKMETSYTTLKFSPAEDKEKLYYCKKCEKTFPLLKQLKAHSRTNCSGTSRMPIVSINKMKIDNEDKVGKKRKNYDNSNNTSKKVAKKSTTTSQNKGFARKSTTRLPTGGQGKGESSPLIRNRPNAELNCIKTMMPFCNKMVPVTVNKLTEIININPVVVVERMEMDAKK